MFRSVRLEISDVIVLTPERFQDDRGFFSETYSRRTLAESGIDIEFVQDNHSYSTHKGTVRGLHFQTPPFAQDKLVRVARGAILDVAVDIRRGSPTFGKSVSAVISAENWKQMFIPKGFAHGFCTLEAATEVLYKASDYYAREHDRGLLWNDPALDIRWPTDPEYAVLSDKDRAYPPLSALPDYFVLGKD